MAKARKQFILDSAKIRRVRKILGASTDTEAVDSALDMVISNAEIAGIHSQIMGRCSIKDMDQSNFNA